MGLSCFFDGLNVLFISQFKGLQAHPMKLYLWLSFATFFVFWNNLLIPVMCPLHLEFDLHYTLGLTRWHSMENLILAGMFQTTFAYSAVITINICLCHDLIYTLRDPFRNPEERYSTYFAIVLIVAFIISMVRIESSNPLVYGYLILGLFLIYLSLALVSVIFAWRYVRQPGISAEARILIVRIHVVYIVVNVMC